MYRLVVKRIGDALAIEISPELARALEVREGDAVYVAKSAEASAVSGQDSSLDEGLRVAQQGLEEYREALRKLAQ